MRSGFALLCMVFCAAPQLYLIDPQQITRTARTLQLTLGLIVLVLIAAIVAGGALIAADVRRQMRLAQQKTDFVSNVSHELKTPLTSIRMFADLLSEGRVEDDERKNKYLRIISAESARLTRLALRPITTANSTSKSSLTSATPPPGSGTPPWLVPVWTLTLLTPMLSGRRASSSRR